MSNNGGAESYPFSAQKRSLEDGGTTRGLTRTRPSFTLPLTRCCVFPQINPRAKSWRLTETAQQPCVRVLLSLSVLNACVCIFRAVILSLSHSQLSEPSWLPFLSRGKSVIWRNVHRRCVNLGHKKRSGESRKQFSADDVLLNARVCFFSFSVRPSAMTEDYRVPDGMVGLSKFMLPIIHCAILESVVDESNETHMGL